MNRNLPAPVWLPLACLIVTMLGGCQRAAPPMPTLHPVSGNVVYKNGGPVVGRIKFRPIDPSNYVAEGILGKDGKFSLSTARPGDEERTPGVPVGEYTVSVIPVTLGAIQPGSRPDIQLPDHAHVKEGENTFTFEVSRKP